MFETLCVNLKRYIQNDVGQIQIYRGAFFYFIVSFMDTQLHKYIMTYFSVALPQRDTHCYVLTAWRQSFRSVPNLVFSDTKVARLAGRPPPVFFVVENFGILLAENELAIDSPIEQTDVPHAVHLKQH